ncbi:hypothetical protein FQN55_003345 [Onygenales sp. PD_40]|nr:hypothetical protein FQN55_003345 [Onygenales sp. PD_40]KAK2758891.1 hypothetical protein FQN53_008169 [Emmonsiellopsis sp. PD_33]
MEKQRHDFVKGLPSDTGEYNYLGFEHLKQVLTQHEGLFVIFNGVSPEEFEKHQNHFPGRLDYNSSLKLLILNMPAFPHEEAAGEFDSLVTSKAIEMSIRDEIYFRSATRAETPDREKQADRSWSPRPNPPGRSLDWPTVVLEVAFSESREKIKRDISWWLHQSKGDVLLGLTIDIKRPSGNIYLTSWERGRMPTRLHPNPEPRPIQEIKVSRNPTSLTGDDLVIPFHQLMLRTPGPRERDFIFTKTELQGLAEKVWEVMGLK